MYRAPSWSWASVDAPTWYASRRFEDSKIFFVVEEANVTLVDSNPFGKVSDGYLQVRCRALLPMKYSEDLEKSQVGNIDVLCTEYPDGEFIEWRGELYCMDLLNTEKGRWVMVLKLLSPGVFCRMGLIPPLQGRFDSI